VIKVTGDQDKREWLFGCGPLGDGLRHCATRHVRRITLIETSCATDSSPLGVPRTATGKRITKLTNLFYSCRELSSSATGTKRPIFLQNKANFCKAEIIVSSFVTS
jgi:hypothetical protein